MRHLGNGEGASESPTTQGFAHLFHRACEPGKLRLTIRARCRYRNVGLELCFDEFSTARESRVAVSKDLIEEPVPSLPTPVAEDAMDTVKLPYNKAELSNPEMILNRHFLEMLEEEILKQAVFDHPFLIKLSKGVYSEKAVRFAFIQFSKHVKIFTSCLGHIIGNAPTIRDRLVLFDNLNEEMGKGALLGTHYMLYVRMLSSMGISSEEIDRAETMISMQILNDGLEQAVKRSFVTGLAWLGLGGELTIPNNFPYLAQGAKKTFAVIDTEFFARHGAVDDEHKCDSNLLLAMQIKTQADRDMVRTEVHKSLFLRAAVWDEIGVQAARM
jgi:pyrroloquinoline quinone (PQQ) biosynthesis protein C